MLPLSFSTSGGGVNLRGGCHAALRHLEQRERQHCYGIAQSQLGYLTRQVENIFNTTRLLAERCVKPDGGVTDGGVGADTGFWRITGQW